MKKKSSLFQGKEMLSCDTLILNVEVREFLWFGPIVNPSQLHFIHCALSLGCELLRPGVPLLQKPGV